MRLGRNRERGAAMIEMAIVIPIFLVLVFAIIEFSMAIFTWSRVIESSRAGARYAIVSDVECSGVSGMVCPGSGSVSCALDADSKLLAEMQKVSATIITEENVNISYACSDAGFDERPTPVLHVTVTVSDVEHQFIVPGLFGFATTMTMPTHATTRTSEDLYTAPED